MGWQSPHPDAVEAAIRRGFRRPPVPTGGPACRRRDPLADNSPTCRQPACCVHATGPSYALDVVLGDQHAPGLPMQPAGATSHREGLRGRSSSGGRAVRRADRGARRWATLFRGILRCRGAGESGLLFGGASFEPASDQCATARSACPATGGVFDSRSPRPGVSPSCPEHDGLTSRSARRRAGESPASAGPAHPEPGRRLDVLRRGRWEGPP